VYAFVCVCYSWGSPSQTAAAAIQSWLDEKADFTYPTSTLNHYTQVIWATTTAVGCGTAQCPSLSIGAGQVCILCHHVQSKHAHYCCMLCCVGLTYSLQCCLRSCTSVTTYTLSSTLLTLYTYTYTTHYTAYTVHTHTLYTTPLQTTLYCMHYYRCGYASTRLQVT
jgi:Cysteine-rich secretory protein family